MLPKDKCRTCRFLALPEGNTSSGYCWQSDKVVPLKNYTAHPICPKDPGCESVHGEDSVWEPLEILKPYFDDDGIDTCKLRKASWDNDGESTWGVICSSCGYAHEHETGTCWVYCPNCGARVTEVDE